MCTHKICSLMSCLELDFCSVPVMSAQLACRRGTGIHNDDFVITAWFNVCTFTQTFQLPQRKLLMLNVK